MKLTRNLRRAAILSVVCLSVTQLFGALAVTHPVTNQEIPIGSQFNVTGTGGVSGMVPVVVKCYKDADDITNQVNPVVSVGCYAPENGNWATGVFMYSGGADDNGWVYATQTGNDPGAGKIVQWVP